MKDFVSTHWIAAVALIACVAAVCVVLGPQDFALRGFAWGTLGLSALALSIGLVAGRSGRSIGQMLQDVDHAARPVPALAPSRKSHRKE